MAERFNLTAQIQLQAPSNTSRVVDDIRKQLSGITANVQIKGDARTLAKINKQMQGVDKASASASKSMGNLNRNLSEAARRFSIITVATGTMLALARAVKNAVGEAIAFERELIKISQVTGKTVSQLQGLTTEVTRLATGLGASSKDLLEVSRVLAQAGFAAEKTRQALDILAKTSLGATFNNIQDTTEGAIAVLRQFGAEAKSVGGDIKFLEQTMDAINSVSKKFAVESGDLITVIRRVGGVFSSAGGSVNELIALFTSVRATTRESAETISTGLRTIFTRIQRTDTVDQLAALGIQLRDSQGQFVGAYEAVRRLSQGLSSLNPKDFRFSEIVESLGGFRQIGKVIPLIQQFTTAQDALNVAQSSSGSVARDAATAQKSLAVQAAKVKEEFSAMIRSLTDSSTFRAVAKGALEMASAFIRIVEALEPLLPLITSLIALKIGSALAPGLGALTGIGPKRKAAGGRIQGFAGGGFVPGSGNRDTVPAMLQPGEFVIKKSSAKKLGSGTLESMNQNRFKVGGEQLAKQIAAKRKDPKFSGRASKGGVGVLNQLESQITNLPKKDVYGGAFLSPEGGSQDLRGSVEEGAVKAAFNKNATFKLLKSAKKGSVLKKEAADLEKAASKKTDFTLLARSLTPELSTKVEAKILDGVESSVRGGAAEFAKATKVRSPNKDMSGILRTANVDNVIGNLFEASVLRAGAPYDESERDSANAPFDFPGGLGGISKAFTNAGALSKIDTDAKTRYTSGNISSFLTKVRDTKTNQLTSQLDRIISELDPSDIQEQFSSRGGDAKMAGKKLKDKAAAKKAHGGKIDSVPALLTPGEYVINKSSAQSIGYGNLNKMNKTGAQKFATGGAVGWKRFAGGGPTGKGLGLSTAGGAAAFPTDHLNNVENAFKRIGVSGDKLTAVMTSVESSLEANVAPAQAFDKAFEEMKNGIKETKDAAEAAAKVSGPGDQVAMDVNKFGGEIDTGVSTGGLVEGAQSGDKGLQAALADAQAREIAVIQRKIKSTESTVTSTDAYKRAQDVVRDKYGVLAKEIEKSKSSFQKLRAKTNSVGGAVGGAVAKGAGGVGRAAKGAGGAAQGAQQFAFMATVAGGAAIQMSSLSDATKQAATETLGFAAGIVGAGATAIQMLSGLADIGKVAAASEVLETAANATSTGSEEVETAANLRAAASESVGGMGGASKALLGVAAAAAVVAIAFKYFAAKARAEADVLAKSTDKLIADLEAGKGGDAAGIKSNVQSEIGKRGEAAALDSAALAGGGAALAAGGLLAVTGGAAALGAALGTTVPVVGTVVGALVGLGVGLYIYSTANEEAVEAAKKQRDSINGSIDAYVNATKGLATFNQQMADIDIEKNLAPEERVERRLEAGKADVGAGTVGGEFDKLGELAAKAGKSIAQLTEADFKDTPEQLQAFKFATAATQKTMEGLAAKTKAARDTLAEAAALEMTGEFSFDELIAQGGNFALSLKAAQGAIQQETQTKVKAIKAEAASMRAAAAAKLDETGNVNANVEAVAAAEAKQQEATAAQERGTQQLNDLTKGQQMAAEAAMKQRDAELAAAAAAEALRVELNAMNSAMKGLRGIQAGQEKQSRDIAARGAINANEDLDFSSVKIQGLDDISVIDDVRKFEGDVGAMINDLPPAMQGQFKKMLGAVTEANEVLTTGKDKVLKQFGTITSTDKVDVGKIIQASGADLSKLPAKVAAKIESDLANAAAAGGIDAATFDEIFSPLEELGTQAAANLKELESTRETEIKNHKEYVNVLQSERDKELQGKKDVMKAQQKGEELMAKARGKKLTAGQKDTQRTDSAQVGLSGTGVQAGDARGAAKASVLAKKRRAQIQRQLSISTLGLAQTKRLMTEDKKLIDIVKKTGNELDRLGDQSERASDILEEIDAERAKREAITSILTDFVKGGKTERKSITDALLGVKSAVATGTVQNQSPEQRSATFDMLDKLKNIFIQGAGGLTGEEVKQQLVFQDAIRMGLDPATAEMLATATSKEQELINALDRLTKVQVDAARLAAGQVFASGGLVQHRAGGGGIFQSKGTDTVPAMLTPGEFVIKKSAADSIGAGNLKALNRSKGGVVYRMDGGEAPAADAAAEHEARLDAMLAKHAAAYTPIIERERDREELRAVQRHEGKQQAARRRAGVASDAIQKAPTRDKLALHPELIEAQEEITSLIKKGKEEAEARARTRSQADVAPTKEQVAARSKLATEGYRPIGNFFGDAPGKSPEQIEKEVRVNPFTGKPRTKTDGNFFGDAPGKSPEQIEKSALVERRRKRQQEINDRNRKKAGVLSWGAKIAENYRNKKEKIREKMDADKATKFVADKQAAKEAKIAKDISDNPYGIGLTPEQKNQRRIQKMNQGLGLASDASTANTIAAIRRSREKRKKEAEVFSDDNIVGLAEQREKQAGMDFIAQKTALKERQRREGVKGGLIGRRSGLEQGREFLGDERHSTKVDRRERAQNFKDKVAEEMRRENVSRGVARMRVSRAMAGGGLVQYRAGGGSIFQPKGTDTVPAMLTPGEFVIKKSAVDNIGMGNLEALNRSNGGAVQYRQEGGGINPLKSMVGGGQGGNPAIKIPSGEQYKQMFYQSMLQTSPKQFVEAAESSGVLAAWAAKASRETGRQVSKDEIIKAFIKLNKVGSLDVTKFKSPDIDAKSYDRIAGASRFLERVNSEEVKFKDFPTRFDPTVRNTEESTRNRLAELIDLQKGLRNISGGMSTMQALAGNAESKFAGRIINNVLGRNPERRLRALQAEAAERQKKASVAADILKRAIAAGGPWPKRIGAMVGMAGGAGEVAGGGLSFEGGKIDGGIFTGGVDTTTDKDPSKKKKAVPGQQFLELLQQAGALQMATGGSVPGFANGGQADTVPAMLTPGEFVMSKNAVQQHGMGYMKNLNKGRIPGFNRGGVVGRGNVQYKYDGGEVGGGGGVMSIDPTRLQGVLDTFNTSFSASLDKIVGPFASVSDSLGRIADAFGAMTMTHTFSGALAVNVNIGNKDAIIAEVKKGIMPGISELIKGEMVVGINALKNEATG